MTAGLAPDSSVDRYLRDIEQALSSNDLECPTFVDAALSARMALRDPDLPVPHVARVVAAEPLLSARVVAYANSAAANRGGKPITDVKSAVIRIGQSAVRNISVALALRQVTHAKELMPFRRQARELLEHGLEVAVLSHVLALHHGKVGPDAAWFAGLVHDLGNFYALWRATQFPALVAHPHAVMQLVHACHAAIGGAILRGLNLGEPIVVAISRHEDDPAGLAPGSLSQLLSVANRCANASGASSSAHAGTMPAVVAEGGLDEPTAHALIAEHFDEVTWLLAAVRG